jgi:hypothetical protein
VRGQRERGNAEKSGREERLRKKTEKKERGERGEQRLDPHAP